MKKYTYYTPIDLARCILDIMPKIEIKSIIDICCGSWNLLKAGSEKYPDAEVTGIDIDESSEKYRFGKSQFQIMDGREFARKEYKQGKTYDLILSNPPFGNISKEERIYLAEDDLAKVCYSKLLNKRYECEMMQANMLLAHERSVLLFILPYTFVAGVSFQKVRCQIAGAYSVLAIVKLPFSTFVKEGINTFAIILQKGEQCKETMVYNAIYKGNWKIEKMKAVSSIEIKEGNWWFVKKNICQDKIKVFRGNVSSDKFTKEGQTVLHCAAKKTDKWRPSVRYYSVTGLKKNIVKAKKGDILINRIGKDAGYWHINEIDNIAVSDCLLVLSGITKNMLKILKKNSDGDGRLKIPVYGVAASYVTAEDAKLLFSAGGKR